MTGSISGVEVVLRAVQVRPAIAGMESASKERNHRVGEALHFFELQAELEQAAAPRPRRSNSAMRSAICSGVPTSPERRPRFETE